MVRETCLHQPRFAVSITGLRSLGRGVAFTMHSGPLCDLRAKLADHFAAWLTPQDKQRFEPHVTVQNKVSPSEAATLLSVLRSQFEPFEVLATGVQCWHYLDGPWELVQEFVFAP
jgi:2'-5' RNA ligase